MCTVIIVATGDSHVTVVTLYDSLCRSLNKVVGGYPGNYTPTPSSGFHSVM